MSSNKFFNLPIGSIAVADDGIRLDKWLIANFYARDSPSEAGNPKLGIPDALLKKWIRTKKFRVILPGQTEIDAAHATGTTKLAAGTRLVSDKEVAQTLQPLSHIRGRRTGAGIGSATAVAPVTAVRPEVTALATQLAHSVLYADEDMVAIRKPAGVAVQGGTGVTVSVADALQPLAMALCARGQDPNAQVLRLVHRLDRDVSGILLLARNRNAAARLCDAFSQGGEAVGVEGSSLPQTNSREAQEQEQNEPLGQGVALSKAPHKQYVGIVAGPLPARTPASGIVSIPVVHEEWSSEGGPTGTGAGRQGGKANSIGAAGAKEGRQGGTSGPVSRTESSAHTAYSVPYSTPALSLVVLWPSTGRKHQLRQHVRHLFGGKGLLGDSKYGGSEAGVGAQALRGIGLHLACLRLPAGTLGPHQRRDIALVDPLPHRMREHIVAHGVPAVALAGIGPYAPAPAAGPVASQS